MADMRRTITPAAAMRRAPAAMVIEMIAGRSSGVRPTARATENSRLSSSGRCRARLPSSTSVTITVMIRVSMVPNCRMPRSKSVSSSA